MVKTAANYAHCYSAGSTPWTEASSRTGMTTPFVNMEELEDSFPPVYLRDNTTFRAYYKERQRLADLERMGDLIKDNGSNQKNPTPKWKVVEINYNAWRENTIDNKTIYNLQEETVKDSDSLPPKSRPPSPERDLDLKENFENKRERTYIHRTRTGIKSADLSDSQRFWSQTIKQYNRPIDGLDNLPYRSPRIYPREGDEAAQADIQFMKAKEPEVESITKIPSSLKTLPRRLKEVGCRSRGQFSHQFCDVLGPAACSVCLEFANRKIAGEVQRAAFPELDCTVTTLVAPKLFRFLQNGEKVMKTQQNSKIRAFKSGILRLPSLGGEGPRFGRAGIERKWEHKAKLFYAEQNKTVLKQ